MARLVHDQWLKVTVNASFREIAALLRLISQSLRLCMLTKVFSV